MTRNKGLKRLVRARMQRTGERYTEAMRHITAGERYVELAGWEFEDSLIHQAPDLDEETLREGYAYGGLDKQTTYRGKPCAVIGRDSRSPALSECAVNLRQTIDASDYRGERVRFSGWIRRTHDADHCYVGVGAANSTVGGGSRYSWACATTEWSAFEAVADILPSSNTIWFGATLVGAGKLWMCDVALEVVDRATPLSRHHHEDQFTRLAEVPRNIDFTRPGPQEAPALVDWLKTGGW